ncbi:PLP-dependent aminotransferase family protein [Aquabacterium sp.]|uniref:aminotransferase-like domain-containing protein n=1 Tax=Aquabacterium sp. TaxID=1872578 RepID=UPI00378506A2
MTMTAAPPTLYRRLAHHYLDAMRAGTLAVGDRFPSVRKLMSTHEVSLSTALQTCRYLEDQGWLEARPRSGYYVQAPRRSTMLPAQEVNASVPLDPADYVGIHAHVSEILARGQQKPVKVNLALAVGSPELYPAAALQRSMQRLLRTQPALLTTMVRRHGHPALRQALVRRALARGITAAPEEVVVTHGCIEAVNLALRAVARPGDTVAVESPTFYGLLQVLEALGLRALEIPASPFTGLSLDALAFALEHDPSIKAVVSMPTLHNPLGTVMPDAHKERLVQLCAERGVALIEDDIYGDMGSDDTPYRAAKAYDREGHVIYCQSLNKLIAPGLRLGWLLAGRWQARVEMLKYTQSRYSEELPQMAAAEFIAGAAFDRHLRQLRQALRRQREQMAESVARYFPEGTRLSVPEGGMLLWVQLPEGVSSYAVFEQALEAGIKLAPGSMFTNSRRCDNFVRLSCGRLHTPAVDGALREVGEIVARLRR